MEGVLPHKAVHARLCKMVGSGLTCIKAAVAELCIQPLAASAGGILDPSLPTDIQALMS